MHSQSIVTCARRSRTELPIILDSINGKFFLINCRIGRAAHSQFHRQVKSPSCPFSIPSPNVKKPAGHSQFHHQVFSLPSPRAAGAGVRSFPESAFVTVWCRSAELPRILHSVLNSKNIDQLQRFAAVQFHHQVKSIIMC